MNPIKRGVCSGTCGSGGRFHEGIGGRSAAEWAAAARGKLSTIGGGIGGSGLNVGWSGITCFGGASTSGAASGAGADSGSCTGSSGLVSTILGSASNDTMRSRKV